MTIFQYGLFLTLPLFLLSIGPGLALARIPPFSSLTPNAQSPAVAQLESCKAISSVHATGNVTYFLIYPDNSTLGLSVQEKEKLLSPLGTIKCFQLVSVCSARIPAGVGAEAFTGALYPIRHYQMDPRIPTIPSKLSLPMYCNMKKDRDAGGCNDNGCPTSFFLSKIDEAVAALQDTLTIPILNCTGIRKDNPISVSIANASRKHGLKVKCGGEQRT